MSSRSDKRLCPVCGSPVIHHYSDEGTHSYQPDLAENQRLRDALMVVTPALEEAAQGWSADNAYERVAKIGRAALDGTPSAAGER